MCGRAYHTYTDEELALRYLTEKAKRNPLRGLKPNFNLSPTQMAPIVRAGEMDKQIESFRWGLVPAWCKTVKDASKYSLINARSEEIAEKRSYATPFRKRRCIVPLSGFIEWKREGNSKRPFAISLKSQPIMSLAGIWEEWISKESGEIVHSFAVVTTAANDFMAKIHNRMPVILDKKDEDAWLDPENQNPAQLSGFLKSCPDSWLQAVQVSTLINSPRNNTPEVLEPVSE